MSVLISWNVAGRRALQPRQATSILRRDVDLVCLQEVTPATASAWRETFERAGMAVEISELAPRPERARRLGVLLASCSPLRRVAVADMPWPERHLAARTNVAGIETEVHVVHAPLSSKPDRVKVLTLERLFEAVTADDRPRIVAGDLNTPRYESREGKVTTFARTRAGIMRPELGVRHDQAELALIEELPRRGWSDAFRALHGYDRRDRSWTYPGRSFGYRIDHVLVSPQLAAVACEYLHDWREQGLSDHAGIWAEVAPGGAQPTGSAPAVPFAPGASARRK